MPVPLTDSQEKVYTIIKQSPEITHKDIVRFSRLASRTVRYATQRLDDLGLIELKFNFRDSRQVLYRPRKEGEAI